MSWQTYVDTSLIGSGNLAKGALISAAGDSMWAHSPGFELKPHEMKTLAEILRDNKAAKDEAFAKGLHIAGTRYVMARADGRSIYARHDKTGVAIAKTLQAIIIGYHNEEQQAGNATSTVEGLADYLIKQKY